MSPLVAKWLGRDVIALAHVGPYVAAVVFLAVVLLAIRINRDIGL